MRRLLYLCLLCLLPLLAGASATGTAPAPGAASATERFVLGVLATRPLPLVEQEHQPLADYLAQQLNAEVQLHVLDDAALNRALERGQIDFLLTSPGHYMIVRRQFPLAGLLATLIRQDNGQQTTQLGGVIIALAARTDLRTLADLEGQRIAALPPRTLAGYQIQAYELLQAGFDVQRDFAFTHFEHHDAVVQAVLTGQADAGFVRTGILEALKLEGRLRAQQLHVIHAQQHPGFPFLVSTRLYPEWAFAAMERVDPLVARRAAAALMLLPPGHPVTQGTQIAGFAPPQVYIEVEDVTRALRLPPFDAAPEFTWADVWERHKNPLLALAVSFLAIVALLGFSLWHRRELQRQRDALDRLIQLWPQPMLLIHQQRFVQSNRAALALLGLEHEHELLGRTPWDISPPQQSDGLDSRQRVQAVLDAVQHGQVTRLDWDLSQRDGALVAVEFTLLALEPHAAQRSNQRILCGWTDLTLRKQTERLLQQHADNLARSNAELEQFAYVASHDLRQPLRMINSYVQLLERRLADRLDEETRQMMGFVTQAAQRMDQMLVALLEYSRVGRLGEPMEALSMREVLDEALRFLAPLSAETQAQIRVRGHWPELLISRNEITRLWQNLVGNSLKFRAPDRAPQIEISAAPDEQGWRFEVADNGIGIDPGQFERLFRVFQRLHTRSEFEGTGIGLALARKIVERHGGRIWVESAGLGQGSRFVFFLPTQSPDSAHAEPQS
ncbi:signal transduction histidine kinase [Serpentinimonas raichei]|uniref:histidine kinase n=1 Tax=Serpentinimonas raichei TaxID=1458425 RepID=A0A060NI32_9BURK|nr:PhnD/SsuA/transferrin family substrate-binding protein [Serpentinimonas raichei]BAO80887.1 signal transduction histidine kinase [Serpentinimonas raichei]